MLAPSLLALAVYASLPQVATKPPAAATTATVDAARLAAARQLIDASGIDATLDRMYIQLAPVFAHGVIGALSAETETRDALSAIQQQEDGQQRLVAILSQEFLTAMKAQYPALKDIAAREYAEAFTTAELEELLRFYSSGTGAKALQLLPVLQQKMAQSGQELGRAAGVEAGQRAFERAAREILKIDETKPRT